MSYCWYVLRMDEKGRSPQKRHTSEESAREEAERLAIANPGVKFSVVRLVASVAVNTPMWFSG